jgi:hypothetical protein
MAEYSGQEVGDNYEEKRETNRFTYHHRPPRFCLPWIEQKKKVQLFRSTERTDEDEIPSSSIRGS